MNTSKELAKYAARNVILDSIQVLPYDVHGNELGGWFIHWMSTNNGEIRAHSRGVFRTRWGAEHRMKKVKKLVKGAQDA